MPTDERTLQLMTGTLADSIAVPPIVVTEYTPVAGDYIGKARAKNLPRAVWVQVYRAYYEGHQKNALTDEQKTILKGLYESGFCDNITKQVIDINVGRTEFEGWTVGLPPHNPENEAEAARAEQEADDVLETLDNFHTRSGMDALQNKTARAAQRDGNAYWGLSHHLPSNQVIASLELAWDGYEGMWLSYGQDGRPEYAVKEWMEYEAPIEYRGALGVLQRFADFLTGASDTTDEPVRYRTLYLPNKVAYLRLDPKSNRWEPFKRIVREVAATEFPLTDGAGSPIGIPVIHFPNRGGEGKDGTSELDGGFIGGQDNVNDTQYNLGALGRYTAFMRVAVRGAVTVDAAGNPIINQETGKPIKEDISGISSPAGVLLLSNPAGGLDYIPAGDSTPLLNILASQISTLCRNTGTPEYIARGTTPPSGVAVLELAAPLVNKAKEQVNLFAPAYASAAHYVTVLLNTYAGKKLNTDALIRSRFAPTDRRDPLSLADYVSKLGEDVSHAERLRQLGYNTQDVARIIAEREAEVTTAAQRDLLLYETLAAADTALISPEFALERMGFDATEITAALKDRANTQAARISDISGNLVQ